MGKLSENVSKVTEGLKQKLNMVGGGGKKREDHGSGDGGQKGRIPST